MPLAILMLLLLAACSREPAPAAAPDTVTAPVVEVAPSTAAAVRAVTAEVQAKGRMELASKITGTVRQTLAAEGEAVAQGQALLVLDDADLAARAEAQRRAAQQAEAAAQAAQVRAQRAAQSLTRLSRLLAQGAVAQDEVDQAQAQAQALAREAEAQAALAQSLRATLQETEAVRASAVVTAPAAGKLTRRLADAGAFVRAGQLLAVVEDERAGLELVAEVDESWATRLAPGATVTAAVPALAPEPRPVRVTAIVPSVDRTRFRVKTTLPEGLAARSGMFARLLLPEPPRPRLLIPAAALRWRGGLPVAFAVDGAGTVRLRVLRLGAWFLPQDGQLLPASGEAPGAVVEVLAGLAPGERLLLEAPESTREGMAWRAP